MGEYYIFMGIGMVMSMIGMFIGNRLKSKFEHYSRVPLPSGLSGKEVAEKMLQHYNIYGVQIVEGQGYLSDHYNPSSKIISLSPAVYNGRSVAAAAVAAHECGHAVQHDTAYSMLQMRSMLVPVVQVSAQFQQYALMGAFMMVNTMPSLLLVAIALFAVTAAFSFVTLPVEFDASNRALKWLENSNVATGEALDGAKDALWWAAMTYVSAALSALVSLLYLILRYTNRD